MKKMMCFAVVVVISTTAAAQETVELIQEMERQQGKEVFTVLKSDRKIKHGPYKKLNFLSQVTATGYYKDNKKDSTWEQFNVRGGVVFRGNYVNDEKAGVWEYYLLNDELEQKYDHTEQKLIYFKAPRAEAKWKVYQGNDTILTTLDQPPLLIGGNYVVQNTLLRNLRYPHDAIDKKKMGTVVIGFDVNADGSVSNYIVRHSVFRSLDQEALRVIKLVPHQWLPGIKDGQKVKVQMLQPVVFRME